MTGSDSFITWFQQHTRWILYSCHKTWGCDRVLCAGPGLNPVVQSSPCTRRFVWEYSLCFPSFQRTVRHTLEGRETPLPLPDPCGREEKGGLKKKKDKHKSNQQIPFAWVLRNIIGPNHHLFRFVKSLTAGLDKRERKICRVQDCAKTLSDKNPLLKPDVDSTGQFW